MADTGSSKLALCLGGKVNIIKLNSKNLLIYWNRLFSPFFLKKKTIFEINLNKVKIFRDLLFKLIQNKNGRNMQSFEIVTGKWEQFCNSKSLVRTEQKCCFFYFDFLNGYSFILIIDYRKFLFSIFRPIVFRLFDFCPSPIKRSAG